MDAQENNLGVDAAAGASRPRWRDPSTSRPSWDSVGELRSHVARLHDLLSDPQVGLGSWSVMMGEEWKWIAEAWRYGFDEHGPLSPATGADATGAASNKK
jgi:hypothetical protein